MAVGRRCIHAGGTRLLRCSPGYACIAEHRQRGASTPLVLTLFRKRWSRTGKLTVGSCRLPVRSRKRRLAAKACGLKADN
ncbi:MAG: hypothetical protein V3T83_18145 [Acidobacteriota bacterium]